MVPPSNLPELRSTLGVFVQSSRFIPRYSHIVAPLTALTRSAHGKPVPFVWDTAQQTAFDQVRNLLLDGIHLSPADYRLQILWPQPIQRPAPRNSIHRYGPLRIKHDRPTCPTPSLTTMPAVYTLPGGLSAGLRRIGNAPPSTSKPTRSCGASPSLASTPSRPPTPYTPTAITYLLSGCGNATKAPFQLSPSSNCPTYHGCTVTSPDPSKYPLRWT
jgi:hypothetical protein